MVWDVLLLANPTVLKPRQRPARAALTGPQNHWVCRCHAPPRVKLLLQRVLLCLELDRLCLLPSGLEVCRWKNRINRCLLLQSFVLRYLHFDIFLYSAGVWAAILLERSWLLPRQVDDHRAFVQTCIAVVCEACIVETRIKVLRICELVDINCFLAVTPQDVLRNHWFKVKFWHKLRFCEWLFKAFAVVFVLH